MNSNNKQFIRCPYNNEHVIQRQKIKTHIENHCKTAQRMKNEGIIYKHCKFDNSNWFLAKDEFEHIVVCEKCVQYKKKLDTDLTINIKLEDSSITESIVELTHEDSKIQNLDDNSGMENKTLMF